MIKAKSATKAAAKSTAKAGIIIHYLMSQLNMYYICLCELLIINVCLCIVLVLLTYMYTAMLCL